MPVYLVHGFRWPRDGFSGIRVHAIVHNLEDCSVEYIQNENSREELLGSFRKQFGDLMKEIEADGKSLDFIEQYNPDDLESDSSVSQPHAFVADKVVELAGQSTAPSAGKTRGDKPGPTASSLSLNVEELIAGGPGLTSKAWEAFADLRDKIAAGAKIGWWVVYNGDPERAYDTDEDDEEETEDGDGGTLTPTAESTLMNTTAPVLKTTSTTPTDAQTGPPVPPKIAPSAKQSFGSRLLPTRSRGEMVNPEDVLPSPKDEKIPEPPKLKEVAKTSGFRKKFFGKKI